MKALTTSVVFSRREKLLLGLLGSTLLFSFSFSYGAVNQAKVDSIMQTINTAANNFSSQADRDTYYQRVYTGLSDAIDMLAVVRNNVGAMIGTAPVTVPPVTTIPPTGGPGPVVSTFVPFQNFCPAGVQPMGGWDIRNLKIGYALSIGNFLKTTQDKPIVLAVNVPKGYSTKGLRYRPSAMIGQAQAGVSEGPVSVYVSTSACVGKPDSSKFDMLNGISHQFYTPDDTLSTSEKNNDGIMFLKIIPGQINYITIWNNGPVMGNLEPQKMYGVNVDFVNMLTSAGGSADQSIQGQVIISSTKFGSFTPGIPQTFPTGSTPHMPTIGGATPTPPTPAPVTNPIANYPIPAPCSAGTVLNKELLGTINGAWIERAFSKATDIVPGHVYKLRIDEEDGQGNGSIGWGDAPPERITQTLKISPYPCDFVTLEQEKKYFGDRVTVAPLLTAWWDSVTVPPSTTIGRCMSIGISGNHQYKIGSAFANPSFSSLQNCTIVKGVTYYVNIRPSFTHMHGNGCNGTYACNYHLVDGGSQKMPSARVQLWGIYNTYEEFLIYKLKANVSSENVESLRQKVVSDYATKGVNTDGLTNTALGGTAVTPPVGTGGGPVVVREGPWERIEDIFCPDTLANLRASYPNTYNYYNQGNTFWNVKNYLTPTDSSLPTSCTTGAKFVKHGMQATCYVYECKN